MDEKKKHDLSLRRANTADVALTAHIVAAAYRESQAIFRPQAACMPSWMDWWHGLSVPQPEDHRRFIEGGLTYLLCLGGEVVGTFRMEMHEGCGELDNFCILPQYQNRGLGQRALALMEGLPGLRRIELATPYFCTANRYLYEKAGYQQTGSRSQDTVICYAKAW